MSHFPSLGLVSHLFKEGAKRLGLLKSFQTYNTDATLRQLSRLPLAEQSLFSRGELRLREVKPLAKVTQRVGSRVEPGHFSSEPGLFVALLCCSLP